MENYPLLDVYPTRPVPSPRVIGSRNSSSGVTFICKANAFKTVRNFTKPRPDRRRSLQPVKLLDGKTDDPDFKIGLVQDGSHGKVASRNIAWTAVYAPSTPTPVEFTLLHSGERSKNDLKGSPVSEFRKVSYLFSKDHSQFDIDVEVLATKETSLLKQRPGGLSIVAEANKKTTGECLGTSHPVAIRGPSRGSENSTPSPPPTEWHSTLSAAASTFHCPVDFRSPDDANRAPPITPSSNSPRVAIKPTPILPSVNTNIEFQGQAVGIGLGFIPLPAVGLGAYETPQNSSSSAAYLRQLAPSPGSALAHGMRGLDIQKSDMPSVASKATIEAEEEDGRRCSHMHMQPPTHSWPPLIASPVQWVEAENRATEGLQLPAVVGSPLRKRGSQYCLTDFLEEQEDAEDAVSDIAPCPPAGWRMSKLHTGVKARKLHTGVKDWTVATCGGGVNDEIGRAHLEQRALIHNEPLDFRELGQVVNRSRSMDDVRGNTLYQPDEPLWGALENLQSSFSVNEEAAKAVDRGNAAELFVEADTPYTSTESTSTNFPELFLVRGLEGGCWNPSLSNEQSTDKGCGSRPHSC